MSGFEHLPGTAGLNELHKKRFEDMRAAIDDLYTNWVLQDYTPGEEKTGMFFDEGFDLTVRAYEIENGIDVSAEDRGRIKAYIQESWAEVERYGFDEPINAAQELINDDPKKVEGEK
jgi:hypothetical protein